MVVTLRDERREWGRGSLVVVTGFAAGLQNLSQNLLWYSEEMGLRGLTDRQTDMSYVAISGPNGITEVGFPLTPGAALRSLSIAYSTLSYEAL